MVAGVKIGRRKTNNLRYADNTTLLARNKDDMVQLIKRVKISSEKAGLELDIKKTRVMCSAGLPEDGYKKCVVQFVRNETYSCLSIAWKTYQEYATINSVNLILL
jgi:hypothetical protein